MQCLIIRYNALNETAHTTLYILFQCMCLIYIPVVLNMQWSVNTRYAPNRIPSRSPTAHNDVPWLAASGSWCILLHECVKDMRRSLHCWWVCAVTRQQWKVWIQDSSGCYHWSWIPEVAVPSIVQNKVIFHVFSNKSTQTISNNCIIIRNASTRA